MNDLVPAIVTGACGIISTLVAVFKDDLKRLLSKRGRLVTGSWRGEAGDIEVPGVFQYAKAEKYEVTCTLRQRGNSITGEMYSTSDREDHLELKGELRGNYLILRFANDSAAMHDWGVCVLEIFNSGKHLKGFYLSPRLQEHGLALGSLELRRK